MITHEVDAFRRNRSAYRISEPLVTFYHAVMRPAWGDLERPGRAPDVWHRAQSTFRSKVVGPHFEQVCREWARWHAAPGTHGGHAMRVAGGTVNDPAARTSHEVDVAIHGETHEGRQALLAIGEAKWSDVMGVGHLERLRHIRSLLIRSERPPRQQRAATETTRLHCFSGTGFTDELHHLAKLDPTIQLIDLPRLYHGE